MKGALGDGLRTGTQGVGRRWSDRTRQDRSVRAVALILGVLALLLLPSMGNVYYLHVATLILIYVPLALGQNLITGNAGQISMGHAAFYGFGAYVVGVLGGSLGWPTATILAVALVGAAVLGFVVGLPAIRVSGDYLFIVTIGINLVFLDVVTQWVQVTGGPSGLPGIPIPQFGSLVLSSYADMYYFALGIAMATTVLVLLVTHSRYGIVLEAVRDDEAAAAACGISVTGAKVGAFVLGASVAGLSGVLYGYFIGFVGPQDFGIQQSLLIFEMAILGGLGSVPGSIIGAALLIGIPEALRPLQPYAVGLGGVVILVLMVFRPQGLMGRYKMTNLIRK